MTREEAINMLYGIQADNLNLEDAYTKDKYEALNMAIKALEQEPLEVEATELQKAYNKGFEDGYLAGQKNVAERFEGLIKSHRKVRKNDNDR